MSKYTSLSEYRKCVEKYHRQLHAYAETTYLDSIELIVRFLPGVAANVWLEMMKDDLCLVKVHDECNYAFFGGSCRVGAWSDKSRRTIEKWFKEHAPGVKIWEGAND
jgi:hypothetical protein